MTCQTLAFQNLRSLLCRLVTAGRIKTATDEHKGKRDGDVHPLYVSFHLLILFFHLLRFNHYNFTIPLAPSTRYKDVRPPSHHSGEFVVAFRLSLFINIISASRIYLGPNSGICHSKFIRGRKPLNSSDGGWSRVAWKLSILSDAERKCESVSSLQCVVLFCQEPFENYLLDQVFFTCELGWRICWRQF